MDASYLYGAGIDMIWDNLWDYRTIQAQTAHGFLQDYFFEHVEHVSKEVFFRYPMKNEHFMLAIQAWVFAYLPLFVQQGIRALKEMEKTETEAPKTLNRLMLWFILQYLNFSFKFV